MAFFVRPVCLAASFIFILNHSLLFILNVSLRVRSREAGNKTGLFYILEISENMIDNAPLLRLI
jgi:hypothetical protein